MNPGPLTFKPAFFPRIWGGRKLSTEFGRPLPEDGQDYGESWEISDRPEWISEVACGPFAGKNLHELWTNHREELFGEGYQRFTSFPLLCKILDARDKLSLQVHPPASVAGKLHGESKTEAWYIAESETGSSLYSGWETPVTPTQVETAVKEGTLQHLVHELSPQRGDSLFLPSGRVHALGAGLVVFEIQENSDTTYRLYDWNRVDAQGNPRELHVPQALQSLDLADIRPELRPPSSGTLVDSSEFIMEELNLSPGEQIGLASPDHFALIVIAEGRLRFGEIQAKRGDFLILPRLASPGSAVEENTRVLRCTVPHLS